MLSAFIENIFAARISIDYDDFVLLLLFCLDFSFFERGDYQHQGTRIE